MWVNHKCSSLDDNIEQLFIRHMALKGRNVKPHSFIDGSDPWYFNNTK